MKFCLASLLALCVCWSANAQVIFSDGFEDLVIAPRFPMVNGTFQLPAGPVVNQLNWVLGELAQPSTDPGEIPQHFSSGWNAGSALDFLDTLRTFYPDARVVDVIGVTPVALTVVIQSGDGTSGLGFLNMDIVWAENQKIGYFSVNGIGSLQYPEDQSLTMAQAADKFQTLSSANSILIARINSQGQCLPVEARNATTLRGTASVFKIWVLGGIAKMLAEGQASPTQLLSLVASEVVSGSALANVPLGTSFTLTDMAILMMGISDNTATDHLHELAGRVRLNQFVSDSGVADPNALIPLLSINEQFHLFSTVPLVDAQAYVNGSEPYQADYVENTLVPLGPNQTYAVFNKQLLSTGSWQASPMDVCQAMASLREYPESSVSKFIVDQALGAQAAQPYVRNEWDRVWYKGGNLTEGNNMNHVYTHAWMMENAGEDAWAVIGMANDPNGAIDQNVVFQIQSLTSRILELAAQ